MVNEDAFIEKPKLLSKQDLISNRNLFTEEERTILLNNPYVATVKNDAVQFTEEFKEIAYNEFVKNKKSMRKIFQENGIDIEILGAKHIRNFTAKLQEKAKKHNSFEGARVHNKRRQKYTPTQEKSLIARIKDLEHKLAYARQKVEFLKKLKMRIWRHKYYGKPSTSKSKICSISKKCVKLLEFLEAAIIIGSLLKINVKHVKKLIKGILY